MDSTLTAFPLVEYIDYYQYLLKISWPAISGLFVIYMFFGIRFNQAWKAYANKGHSRKELRTVGIRLIVSLIVLISYSDMFLRSYEDWLYQPKVFRGVVETLPKEDVSLTKQEHLITIRGREERIQVRVDNQLISKIKEEDRVEVVYLSRKLDVIKCRVLAP